MHKDSLKYYFNNLKDIFSKIEVTKYNKKISKEEGIKEVIKLIEEIRELNSKVIIVGNGGSASIASHFAIDLWKNAKVKAIAFNDAVLLTCISNDYGYDCVFEKPIEVFADKKDLLFAISSSGRSENILKAVFSAKKIGCRVVTLSGFKRDNPLRILGELNFYVPVVSYGIVEITHSIICHFIVDTISRYGK